MLKKPRVVIIHPIASARSELNRLAGSDYRSFEAESAKTGLELAAAKQADLVLINYRLPDMDVDTAVQALMAGARGTAPAIVVLLDPEDAAAGQGVLRAGVQQYMVNEALTPRLVRHALRGALHVIQLERALFQREAALREREAQLRETQAQLIATVEERSSELRRVADALVDVSAGRVEAAREIGSELGSRIATLVGNLDRLKAEAQHAAAPAPLSGSTAPEFAPTAPAPASSSLPPSAAPPSSSPASATAREEPPERSAERVETPVRG